MQHQESYPEPVVDFGWIGESWRLFSANSGTWILFALALTFGPSVISMIGNGIVSVMRVTHALSSPLGTTRSSSAMDSQMILVLVVCYLLELFVMCFLYSGGFLMAVKQVRGEPISPSDIFGGGAFLGKFVGFTLIVSVILVVVSALPGLAIAQAVITGNMAHPSTNMIGAFIAGGLLICLISAVIYALFLPAYPMLINGEDVITTITVSGQTMKHDLGRAVGLIVLLGLMSLATAFTCGLGSFVTIPMTFLVCALVYRDMVGMPILVNNATGQMPPAGAGVWPPTPSIGTYYGQPQYPVQPETSLDPPPRPGNTRE